MQTVTPDAMIIPVVAVTTPLQLAATAVCGAVTGQDFKRVMNRSNKRCG